MHLRILLQLQKRYPQSLVNQGVHNLHQLELILQRNRHRCKVQTNHFYPFQVQPQNCFLCYKYPGYSWNVPLPRQVHQMPLQEDPGLIFFQVLQHVRQNLLQ